MGYEEKSGKNFRLKERDGNTHYPGQLRQLQET
jgi:hypothetical protein